LGPRGPILGVGWGREEAGEGRHRRPGTVAAAACVPARKCGRLGARVGARKCGEQLVLVRRPREERMAGGHGTDRRFIGVRRPDGAWREERGKTSRRPRWARGMGKGGLGTPAGPDAEARYGARGRGAGGRGAA
jgi:hypothetical protein